MGRLLLFRKGDEHLGHGEAQEGMDQTGAQLAEGGEDEAPLVQARMGQAQAGLAQHEVAVEQEVQVDAPRVIGEAARPAEAGLGLQEALEEEPGRRRPPVEGPRGHQVEKGAGTRGPSHGPGLVDRGEAVQGHAGPIAISSLVQFGLKPVCAVFLTAATGLSGTAAAVMLVIFMAPTAPSAYILARQLGGDTGTMASIITFQTLLAFVAMPLIAALALG